MSIQVTHGCAGTQCSQTHRCLRTGVGPRTRVDQQGSDMEVVDLSDGDARGADHRAHVRKLKTRRVLGVDVPNRRIGQRHVCQLNVKVCKIPTVTVPPKAAAIANDVLRMEEQPYLMSRSDCKRKRCA
jgi:hypothetical protein